MCTFYTYVFCYIIDCFKYLHPPMTKLYNHNAVPYDERPHEEKCLFHPKQLLNIYCLDCEKIICKYCNDFGECVGHEISTLNKANSKRRNDIVTLNKTVQKHLTELHKNNKKGKFNFFLRYIFYT